MDENNLTLDEAQRMVRYLQNELERQRGLNGEMRRAVAELARAFQESLARANDAAESGDIERVRQITYENRQAWQAYLQQIVQASQGSGVRSQEPGARSQNKVYHSGSWLLASVFFL